MYLTDEEICIELERALSSMGIRGNVSERFLAEVCAVFITGGPRLQKMPGMAQAP